VGVYDRQIASAKRIIAAKGQLCTWNSHGDGSGGTAAKPAANVITPHTDIPIVFVPLEREYLATFLSTLQDTEIPTGLELAIMGQVDFDPQLRDTITRGSVEYSIHPKNGIEKIDPNGEGAILYLIRVAR
jgi:hypothetical protein